MKRALLRPRLTTRTSRLTIRPFERGDFSAWLQANRDRLPPQNVYDAPLRPESQLVRPFFARMLRDHAHLIKSDRLYNFGLFDRKLGELVGTMSLLVVARGYVQTAWMGYAIYNHHWRNGYGREGGLAIVDLAFRQLKLHRVEAGIQPANRPSVRLARALGMRREARPRKSLYTGGCWVDIDVYAINAEARGIEMKPTVRLSPME